MIFEEEICGDPKNFSESPQLNIRNKPLAAFNPLNCVFIQVDSRQLEFVRQSPLRHLRSHLLAEKLNFLAAKIQFSIAVSVFIHRGFLLFDI